jgi:hypothetical protein
VKIILEHISTLRLFDASRSDLKGKFELEKWEQEHLAECAECRHVKDVFDRQFTGKAGDVSPNSAAS